MLSCPNRLFLTPLFLNYGTGPPLGRRCSASLTPRPLYVIATVVQTDPLPLGAGYGATIFIPQINILLLERTPYSIDCIQRTQKNYCRKRCYYSTTTRETIHRREYACDHSNHTRNNAS
jgi:hypothetical protein